MTDVTAPEATTENTEATEEQTQDTQSQDTQEATTPTPSKAEQIAKYSVDHKVISAGKGDVLRKTHAEAYLELFGENDPFEHPAIAGLSPEKLTAIVQNGASAVPLDERKARAEHYSHLKPVHQWLKGIAAAALIIKAMEAEENPEGTTETVEAATGEAPDQEQVEEIKAEADDTAEGAGAADVAEAEQQNEDSSEQDESDES